MAEGTSIPAGSSGRKRLPLASTVYARLPFDGQPSTSTELVGTINSATAVRCGPFQPGLYEFDVLDDADEDNGPVEAVHYKVGDGTVTATVANFPHKFNQRGVLQLRFDPGQTHVSFIRSATGGLTLLIYASRLL